MFIKTAQKQAATLMPDYLKPNRELTENPLKNRVNMFRVI